MATVNEKMTAIADAIRDKTGEIEPLTLDDMVFEIEEVHHQGQELGFDSGRKYEYDEFWNNYQTGKGVTSTNYSNAFRGKRWTDVTFNPKYKIKCSNAMGMLYDSTITRVPVDIDWTALTTAAHTQQAFYNCQDLISIPKLIVAETTMFNENTFRACSSLETLIIEGTIGQQNFEVSWSTKLTHDSLMSIINALKDFSGTGTAYTVTLGTTNLAKLTDEEKAIATQKGWTLA